MKRRYLQIILAAVLFLLALGLTLYPVVSNWYSQRHQSQIQTAYREVLEQTDTAVLERIRVRAVEYNKSITPGAAEEAYTQESILAASENYVNQLNLGGTGIMGYVVIPKIDVDLPIYHGTGSDALDRGTGHLLGSSLPVGGDSTHAIITGHSGMASQKMFTDLEQLQEGDVFYLRVLDETLAYEVKAVHTVLPHDTSFLGIVPGEDLCTLVTCTPTGINTHRLLVQGSRIKVFFANIKRGGILLIQIAVGSLYMFSVPRGYTDGFNQWCKQIMAICLTAFLQTTLLFLGMLTLQDNLLLGLGIMLTANEVPRIAQQFGLDSSVRVNVSSVVYSTSSAVNLAKNLMRK